MSTITLDRWRTARYDAFRWRYGLSSTQKLALSLGLAVLTGLLAQVRAPLPWTPVPITGQTFAVLLCGVLLGRWWGGISQVIYVGLGVAGVPWFNGWQGGISFMAGPTGGYLIGFILAALFIGHLTDKYVNARQFNRLLVLMFIANFVLIYIPGLVQLDLWSNLVKGQPVSLFQVMAMGLFPFIIGDVIKLIFVAGIAWGITPKRAFNNRE
jgi:biotin transport system substrate-specific component